MAGMAVSLPEIPARPFPWFCPKCRQQEVRRVTMPYQCERMHNGRPLENLSVPCCGNCGELVFDYEADQQLNRAASRRTPAADKVSAPDNQLSEADAIDRV